MGRLRVAVHRREGNCVHHRKDTSADRGPGRSDTRYSRRGPCDTHHRGGCVSLVPPEKDDRVPRQNAMRYPALRRCTRLMAAVLLCITMSAAPCIALGYTYLNPGLEPVLSAHVVSDPGYYPGDTFAMTVVLTNKEQDTSI